MIYMSSFLQLRSKAAKATQDSHVRFHSRTMENIMTHVSMLTTGECLGAIQIQLLEFGKIVIYPPALIKLVSDSFGILELPFHLNIYSISVYNLLSSCLQVYMQIQLRCHLSCQHSCGNYKSRSKKVSLKVRLLDLSDKYLVDLQ